MAFVLDASVTMTWCFINETTPYTLEILNRLRTEGATVPTLWPLEVANTLLVGERRRRVAEAEILTFVQTLQALTITVDDAAVTNAWGPVLALGRAQVLVPRRSSPRRRRP
jgi:predicted nucleic acid-binding protein